MSGKPFPDARKCPRCGRKTLVHSGTRRGKQNWMCRDGSGDRRVCYQTVHPERPMQKIGSNAHSSRTGTPAKFSRKLGPVKRYVITAAQNATPVHEGFLRCLERYCDHNEAELLVVPIRYKNPTSRWSKSQSNDEEWAAELTRYLWNQRKALNPNIVLLGDVKTQPTAISPLAGFESMTAGESTILAHTKLQLRTVPTPAHKMPKILTTTGAVTVPNYTDSRLGKLGEFHHSLSACVVEIAGKMFHLRQLQGARGDGSFYDLEARYDPERIVHTEQVKALVMGDTHRDFIDPGVEAATFGPGGIIDVCKPETLVWHDVNDNYAVNPHHRHNPFNALAKSLGDREDARAELDRTMDFLVRKTAGRKGIVIPSNHNDFLRRWILNSDWRELPPSNMLFYLQTATAMVEGTKLTSKGTEYPDPFVYWARQSFKGASNIEVLDVDESRVIAGIEVGMHGDLGPNGARGSVRNLRRLGTKSFIGHSHTPGIEEGCYQVGTSTRLRLEYNLGPSSWLNTHGLIYPNGKRALINLIEGCWRL